MTFKEIVSFYWICDLSLSCGPCFKITIQNCLILGSFFFPSCACINSIEQNKISSVSNIFSHLFFHNLSLSWQLSKGKWMTVHWALWVTLHFIKILCQKNAVLISWKKSLKSIWQMVCIKALSPVSRRSPMAICISVMPAVSVQFRTDQKYQGIHQPPVWWYQSRNRKRDTEYVESMGWCTLAGVWMETWTLCQRLFRYTVWICTETDW